MKFMGCIAKTFILSLTIIAQVHFAYAQTASILPPAKTTFLDQNGKPLTGGTVQFSIPGTTTPKTTWQDAAETIPNTNPVVLDSAGRALILGSGPYRQQVFDRNHNLIWDQVTASPASSGGGGGGTATGDGDLVGTIKPWAGMTAPNQYMFAAGQQVARALFPALFTAITSSQQVTCSNGNATLSGLTDTTNFWIGMTVEVSCLASGSSTIVSKTATTVTLATAPNVSTNVAAVFFPWGNGNGTTTFTLPDLRGQVIAGNNTMGGTPSSNLTTQFFGATDPNSIGALGGSQSVSTTLLVANLPPITSTGAATTGGTNFVTATGSNNFNISSGAGTTLPTGVQLSNSEPVTTTSTGTTSTPIVSSVVQPTKTANYIIKVTPDQSSATASGVTSLGLMTGDIACGAGMTCTGNVISSSAANTATAPIVLDGSGNISCPTCATTVSAANPVVASRAIAQTLNLAGLNALTTLGYASPGDGGGATFKNIGTAPFIDSQVLSGTTAGTSCTNGTYLGVSFTGSSTGTGLTGNITVSSGVPTVVLSGNQGNAYNVGDVLSQSAFTCSGVPFSYTVSTVSTPAGSFVDLVGNHFQYEAGIGPVNVLAFGVKADWNSITCPDACATNNFAPLEAALQYAGYRQANGAQFDTGNAFGRNVQLPPGAMMICGSSTPFQWYEGTDTGGQGFTETAIKICDSGFTASTNIFTICDPTSHLACILTRVHDFEVFETAAPQANSDIAVWYSNNVQQSNVMERVFTFSGLRTCINWDTGFGGAAIISVEGGECQPNAASVNPTIIPNYSAAVQTFRDMVVETAVTNANFGFLIGAFAGGAIVIDGVHFEGLTSPIQAQPGSNVVINIHNVTGGNSCGSLITRQSGTATGVINAGALFPNGCTHTLNNAGATTDGIITADHQM